MNEPLLLHRLPLPPPLSSPHLHRSSTRPSPPSASSHTAPTHHPSPSPASATQFAWTNLISHHVKCGECRAALQIWKQMQEGGVRGNSYTFVAALKACGCLGDLQTGKQIHALAIQSGVELQLFVANTLIGMYAKCGRMEDAFLIFQRMAPPDAVSWTAMILGYAQRGEGELALRLYEQMQVEGCVPVARTFVAVLKACSCLAAQEEEKKGDGKLLRKCMLLKVGRRIHSQVSMSRHGSDIFVATTLIDMYAKCGSMEDALLVFQRIPHPNVVSWTAMILGYLQRGEGEAALDLYEQMQQRGFAADAVVFVGALKACSCLAAHEEDERVDGKRLKLRSLKKGRSIHSQAAQSGLSSHMHVATSLIDMYAKCGSMEDASLVFEGMLHPDLVAWNAMILGYARRGEGELALSLYDQMQQKGFAPDSWTFVGALKACNCLAAQEEGKEVHGKIVKVSSLEKARTIHFEASKCGFESDSYVANTLLDLYAECGSMGDALQVFEAMPSPDTVSWGAIILGYAENDQGDIALQLYAHFQRQELVPDTRTFVAALMACGSVASLGSGRTIHAEICKVGRGDDSVLGNCLIDMYGKCGSMGEAQQLFDRMHKRDIVTWTALISGYSRQGESKRALFWLQRMLQDGVQPDGAMFLCLLSGCSHVGMVDEGLDYFHAMGADYGITPTIDHYNAIIDLLGRAGHLDDAEEMVKKMPILPNMTTWLTLLSSCRKWSDVGIGRHAFDCAVRLDKNHDAPYVLMSNLYAAFGMCEESHNVRAMRRNA